MVKGESEERRLCSQQIGFKSIKSLIIYHSIFHFASLLPLHFSIHMHFHHLHLDFFVTSAPHKAEHFQGIQIIGLIQIVWCMTGNLKTVVFSFLQLAFCAQTEIQGRVIQSELLTWTHRFFFFCFFYSVITVAVWNQFGPRELKLVRVSNLIF